MPSAGFEPAIPAINRPQHYALTARPPGAARGNKSPTTRLNWRCILARGASQYTTTRVYVLRRATPPQLHDGQWRRSEIGGPRDTLIAPGLWLLAKVLRELLPGSTALLYLRITDSGRKECTTNFGILYVWGVVGTCGYGEGLSGSINAGNFLTSCKVYWLASQKGLRSME